MSAPTIPLNGLPSIGGYEQMTVHAVRKDKNTVVVYGEMPFDDGSSGRQGDMQFRIGEYKVPEDKYLHDDNFELTQKEDGTVVLETVNFKLRKHYGDLERTAKNIEISADSIRDQYKKYVVDVEVDGRNRVAGLWQDFEEFKETHHRYGNSKKARAEQRETFCKDHAAGVKPDDGHPAPPSLTKAQRREAKQCVKDVKNMQYGEHSAWSLPDAGKKTLLIGYNSYMYPDGMECNARGGGEATGSFTYEPSVQTYISTHGIPTKKQPVVYVIKYDRC